MLLKNVTNKLSSKFFLSDYFLASAKRNFSKQNSKLPIRIPIPGVEHVILISSGKGGVGKSSITVNLAFSLQRLDKTKKIGILDADVFGPSIPKMLNLNMKAEVDKQKFLIPLTNYGLYCMSMGFLIDEKDAVVWRGLIVMQAIGQLLRQVKWNNLNYLLIDMPPGTGDVPLSIVQNIPVSGSVIVTTPQEIATQDANKSIVMYNKVNCNILGIVQNMSGYKCTNCGCTNNLFGKNGAKKLSELHNIDILGEVPLNENIQICCDKGIPLELNDENKETIDKFDEIAKNLLSKLKDPLIKVF